MFVKDTLSVSALINYLFSITFFKKTMRSTGTIPDTLLETQFNSHNQWWKAMADIVLASKQQLLGTICKT